MKKISIFFAILGSFLGLGIILIIIGAALGGRIRNLSIGTEYTEKEGVSTELPNISLTDTTDIQKINLDLSASKIKISLGDSFSVQGSYLSKNEVKNGTWTVESSLNDHFYQISIFGILELPFPRRHNRNTSDTITITIPEGITLDEMNFDLSSSDVSIEELNCNDIDLEVSAGDISITSITAREADLEASAGNISIDKYHITGSACLECSVGNISFGARKYSEENICNNLDSDCSLGNIDIYGKLTGHSKLDCSMGDITLNLVGSRANYDIANTSSSLGSIKYTTKNFIKNSGGSNDFSTTTDTSKYGTLNLSCSMGNIDVCYLYGTD